MTNAKRYQALKKLWLLSTKNPSMAEAIIQSIPEVKTESEFDVSVDFIVDLLMEK